VYASGGTPVVKSRQSVATPVDPSGCPSESTSSVGSSVGPSDHVASDIA